MTRYPEDPASQSTAVPRRSLSSDAASPALGSRVALGTNPPTEHDVSYAASQDIDSRRIPNAVVDRDLLESESDSAYPVSFTDIRRATTRARLLSDDEVASRAATPGSLSSSLPADDGMQDLRQQMHQIRDMAMSAEEKALRMHALMVAEYQRLKLTGFQDGEERGRPQTRNQPPGSADHSVSPKGSTTSEEHFGPISSQELEATYHNSNKGNDSSAGPRSHGTEVDASPLGCVHYMRNVKVQCPHCERFHTCNLCHDEVENHKLVRKDIRNMLCMICGTPQRAAEHCRQCQEQTASYYCEICKLWDNNPAEPIYHCLDCGICRRGEGIGKDYIHCLRCNVCVSIQHAEDHRCVERATDCDCPICGDYMFSSSSAVVAMKCGHYIHRGCYDDLMETTYKCPICSRSAVNMELQWRKMDECLESQPMPEQYRETKAWVICNDCHTRSCTPFHWLGNKCRQCDSYNTTQTSLINEPQPDSEGSISRLEAEQHQIARAAGLPHPNSGSLAGYRSRTQSQGHEEDNVVAHEVPPVSDLAVSVESGVEVAAAPLADRLGTRAFPVFPAPPSPLDPDQLASSQHHRRSESSASAPVSISSETEEEMGFWGEGINPGDYMPAMPQLPQMPSMPSMPNLPRMPSVSMPSMPAGWRSPRLFAREEPELETTPDGTQRGWGLDPRQWRLGSPTEFLRSQAQAQADGSALSDEDIALKNAATALAESGPPTRISWDPRQWRLPSSPTLVAQREKTSDDASSDDDETISEAGSGWTIDPRQWRFANQGIFGRSRSVDTAILHSSSTAPDETATSPSSIWNLQPRNFLARRFGSFSIHGDSEAAKAESDEGSQSGEETGSASGSEEDSDDDGAHSGSEEGEEADEDVLDLLGHP